MLFVVLFIQDVINEINRAIGAAGFINEECKKAVKVFGNRVFDMLAAQVYNSLSLHQNLVRCSCFLLLELFSSKKVAQPRQVCSRIGVCTNEGVADDRSAF